MKKNRDTVPVDSNTATDLDVAVLELEAEKGVGMLRLPAIEIRQGATRKLYSFGVNGKDLQRFAAISRVRRDDEQQIQGYQRPEAMAHIADIRKYIESEDPMIPNALVVAFDQRVSFEPSEVGTGEGPQFGVLNIPILDCDESDRPGWLVDGQQRAAAIREARVSEFPVFVTAFITDSQDEQRSQFILVNNTKPLPKGLIYELLPATDGNLPAALQRRKFPALLLSRLNNDSDSPLKGMISTPTNGDGTIKDNSMLRMLENSLSDGALYLHWDSRAGGGDVETMLQILKNHWQAVSEVFGPAWDLPPRKSRLVHGVGIISLGFLMDAIAERFREKCIPEVADFKADLEEISDVCRWCHGIWDFGPGAQRKWNELQNTGKDIQLLANYLLSEYRRRVWDRKR